MNIHRDTTISFDYQGRHYANFTMEDAIKEGVPRDIIDAEITARRWVAIRDQRDALLRACDYAVMPDYPLTDEQLAAVKEYRQALRDIPETAGDPDAVEWPEKPEVLA